MEMLGSTPEIIITAQTIWGEGRGEGKAGMVAIADVICNRVETARKYQDEHKRAHPLFGNGSFNDCCKRPWQFSCWNKGDPNLSKMLIVTEADPQYHFSLRIATLAIEGFLMDTTNGANYYFAKSLPAWPKWAIGKTPCADIGNHLFFNIQ